MSIDAITDCHDPFWPRFELPRLRARLKVFCTVSEAALEVAGRCAVIAAAQEFASWRVALRARGYKRLEDLGGHAHGRALRVCYLCYVEAAILRNLCAVAPRRLLQGRGEHE